MPEVGIVVAGKTCGRPTNGEMTIREAMEVVIHDPGG